MKIQMLLTGLALGCAALGAQAATVKPREVYSFSTKYTNTFDEGLSPMVEAPSGKLLLSTAQTLNLPCGEILSYTLATRSVSKVTLPRATIGCVPSALVKDAAGGVWGVTAYKGSNKLGSLFRIVDGSAQAVYSYAKTDPYRGTASRDPLAVMPDGSVMVWSAFPPGRLKSVLLRHAAPNYLPQTAFEFDDTPLTDGARSMHALADGSVLALGADLVHGGSLLMRIDSSGNLSAVANIAGATREMVDGGDGYFYMLGSSGGDSVLRADVAGNVSLLYTFAGGSDGRVPYTPPAPGGDGWLYGTTAAGGAFDKGTIYRLRVVAGVTQYEKLFDFGAKLALGTYPGSQLMRASDGFMYGRTRGGGTTDNGTIFRFALP